MSDTGSSSRKERPLPAAWTKNPFEAPTAHVEDAKTTIDDTLCSEPNRVAAGRGASWWGEAWRIFRQSPGLWIGIGIVLIIIQFALGKIPVVGDLATSLLFPVFGAGLILGCHSLDCGEDLTFGHLFAGFQVNFGRLLMIGVLTLVGFTIIFLVAMALGWGGGVASSGSRSIAAMMSGLLLVGLVVLLLMIPVIMATWYAPALVVLHDISAFDAMKMSFSGCLRNFLPFLVYGLMFILLAIVATLPIGLGWLVLMPVMFCSTYTSYRDIFTSGN